MELDAWSDVGQFLVSDELHAAATDARLVAHSIEDCRGDEIAGRLAVLDIAAPRSLSPAVRSYLGLDDEAAFSEGLTLAGGGLANGIMAMWVNPRFNFAEVIPNLARAAAKHAKILNHHLHFSFVPELFAPYVISVMPGAETGSAGRWLYLEIAGAQTLDDFVDGLASKPRQNWRADQRAFERLAITTVSMTATSEAIARAVPLVANVQDQGSFQMSPRLMHWRLRRYMECPERAVFTFLQEGQSDVAVSITQRHLSYVADQYVGLPLQHPERVTLYHLAGFLAPLSEAFESGHPAIFGLGTAHDRPKLARGARQLLLLHIYPGRGEK